MGTAVERHQSTLVQDEHYMNMIPRIADQLSVSEMCPDQFKEKPGEIAIVGYSLADLGLRLSVNTLPQMYVVHNRPGMYAQLQMTLAARYGCHIVPLDDESDDKVAVVKVLGKDREWHRVTFTMAQAVKWGLPKKNPNYGTIPDRMLMARAVTKAIGQHCPEAKLLLPAADLDELDDIDVTPADRTVDGDTGEIFDVPRPMSTAPDGSTIPEANREPAITDDERARLIATLDSLPADILDIVKARARELAIPNLRSNRVTRAHGALVAMLIEHAKGEARHSPQEPEDAEIVYPADEEPFD